MDSSGNKMFFPHLPGFRTQLANGFPGILSTKTLHETPLGPPRLLGESWGVMVSFLSSE